ncbi:MarR family transcriptional regulator [Chitinophaga sp. Mgbs1]|uniref:MarR family transcriptional regulator n=1 Tax=Chitinophaga solisilvae TaxID=1233460 RepID=A0A433WKV3_9BACT|nr:MarR family transcriptional regulator [Chitinophaga solisilvae]
MKKNKNGRGEALPARRLLGINLVRTFNQVYEQSQVFFAAYGLTSQQYNVLKILLDADMPMSTSGILEKMIEKNAGVSRLVDRLVLKHLVKKKDSATDKRLIDVMLTTEGKTLVRTVTAHLEEVDDVYAALNDKEVATLNRLLEKLRNDP